MGLKGGSKFVAGAGESRRIETTTVSGRLLQRELRGRERNCNGGGTLRATSVPALPRADKAIVAHRPGTLDPRSASPSEA